MATNTYDWMGQQYRQPNQMAAGMDMGRQNMRDAASAGNGLGPAGGPGWNMASQRDQWSKALGGMSTDMGMGGGNRANQANAMGNLGMSTDMGLSGNVGVQGGGGNNQWAFSTAQNNNGGVNAAGAGQGNGVAAAAIDDPIGNPYQNYQNDLFDPSKWVDNTQAGNNQRYLDNTLPFAQFLQNQQQYGQDFTESQRRWDQQFQQTQQNDQWNQQFARDQFGLTQWQAQQAADQWAKQFAQTQGNDAWNQQFARDQFNSQNSQWAQQFAQQQGNDLWNQQFARDQFNTQTGQWNQQFAQTQLMDAYQRELQNRQQNMDETYRNAQVQDMMNRFGMDQRTAEANIRNQEALRGLDQQRIDMDNRLGQGRLNLDQQTMQMNQQNLWQLRDLDQQRLNMDSRMSDANIQNLLAQQQLGQGRLGLDQQLGTANIQNMQQMRNLDQARLAQELILAREAAANQKQLAAMQAYGRAQAPTTQFIANW